MSRYYSPEGAFAIQIKLWIQNFIVFNVLFQNHFRNQTQFFNLLDFFAIHCSLNGWQTIATVETMNFRILCFIKILQPPLGWQNLDRTIAQTQFHRIKGGSGVPLPLPHQ